MNLNVIAVDTTTFDTYDFLQDGEEEKDLLDRANESRNRTISLWREQCKNGHKHAKRYLKAAKRVHYEVMSFSEFQRRKREYILSKPMEETSYDEWNNAFRAALPLHWCVKNGVEMFCIREMYTEMYTLQYARISGKYYVKLVDAADESTWINHLLAA